MSKSYGNPIPHSALFDWVGARAPWQHAVLMPDRNIATCNGHVAIQWTKMAYPAHIPLPPIAPFDFIQRWEKVPWHLFREIDSEDATLFRALDEAKRTLDRFYRKDALIVVGKGALARACDLHQLARLPRARIQVSAYRGMPILVQFNGGLAIIGAITAAAAQAQAHAQIFPPRHTLNL